MPLLAWADDSSAVEEINEIATYSHSGHDIYADLLNAYTNTSPHKQSTPVEKYKIAIEHIKDKPDSLTAASIAKILGISNTATRQIINPGISSGEISVRLGKSGRRYFTFSGINAPN